MRILVVCLGNICRSPTAEGVLRALAPEGVTVDSAGTGRWHVGAPPDARMQAAALNRGYDLSGLRARQVTRADFDRFDLILAMDRSNLADLDALRPAQSAARLHLYLEGRDPDEMPDPYYEGGFDRVVDLVEAGARRWLAQVADQGR